MTQAAKTSRSHRSEIGTELWPELQQLERAGQSLKEIADWLLTEHQIKVSVPTCSRLLAKIRAAAPIDPPAVPVLDPATDEDQLRSYRARFHRHATCDALSVHAQIAAAKLVIAIMAEQREQRQAKSPAPQSVLPGPGPVAGPAAPTLTAEEEAEQVRQQLRKFN